jgi:hypothetical protein
MKVPDKIYVSKEEMGDVWTLDATTRDNGGEQYICKDALLEWLEDMRFLANSERAGIYQKVIDKLNRM